jgi:hypothetical protein
MTRSIEVSVADQALARALRRAIDEAVRRAVASLSLDGAGEEKTRPPVVRLRTEKRLAALRAEVRGAIVVVGVTRANARRLPRLIDAIRAGGAAGVQLVWDGRDPERPFVEGGVFEVLERARRTPDGPPVVLAACATPVEALRILVASRAARKDGPS